MTAVAVFLSFLSHLQDVKYEFIHYFTIPWFMKTGAIFNYDKFITPWERQEMAKPDKSADYLAEQGINPTKRVLVIITRYVLAKGLYVCYNTMIRR